MERITPAWNTAFAECVPAALADAQTAADHIVDRFHARMAARPLLRRGVVAAAPPGQDRGLKLLLAQQARGLQQHMRATLAAAVARDHLDVFRREASRLPAAHVREAMAPVYRRCAAESGAGCMARMREAMAEHVRAQQRARMFDGVAAAVRARLVAALAEEGLLKEMLLEQRTWLARLYGDWRALLSGVEVPEATRSARDYVQGLLGMADGLFAVEALEGER